MLSLLKKNITAIESDSALSLYGMLLGAAFLVTYFYFVMYGNYLHLSTAAEPICWPFFPNCGDYRFLSPVQALNTIGIFGILSLLFTASFIFKRIKLGYFFLATTLIFEILLIAQDYTFRQNQHYMLLWTTLAFLFLPNKRDTIRFLIVLFYFWAGRLKLNEEWLSGAILYKKLYFIPDAWTPAACAYVIALEMLLIWGLFSRRGIWFWLALFQLFLFHAESWSQVGYFYPILMASILSIFPLCRLIPGEQSYLSDFMKLRLPKPTFITMSVFSLLQIVPLFYSGDARLTGQGRIYALHMFESRQRCETWAYVKFHNGSAAKTNLLESDFAPRTICDLIIYFSRAKNLCKVMRANPDFDDLDFHFRIARSDQADLRPVADISGFCGKNLSYNSVLPNDWLRTSE